MTEAKDLVKGDPIVLNMDEIWIVEDRTDLLGGRDRNIPIVRLSVRKLAADDMTELYVKSEEQFRIVDLELLSAEYLYYTDGFYYFTDLETCDLLLMSPDQVDDSIGSPEEDIVYDIYMWGDEPYCIKVAEYTDDYEENALRVTDEDLQSSCEDLETDGQQNMIQSDEQKEVMPDMSEAEEWYQKGYDAFYRSDYKTAAEHLIKASEAGQPEAQHLLGFLYWRGRGVEKDLERSFYWSSKAAEQGNMLGQSSVAYDYKVGDGVAKDPAMAFYWYSKAAEQGYATAQANLGNFYEHGEGVEKDMEKAIYWYTKAAEQGDANSQKRLKELKG